MQNSPDRSNLDKTRNKIIRDQVNIITPILSERPEIVIEVVEQAIDAWETTEHKSIERITDKDSTNPLGDIMKILNLERKYLSEYDFSRADLDRSMEESYDHLKKSLIASQNSKALRSFT